MNRKFDDLGRIVIPKEVRDELGLKGGSKVNIELRNNEIVITKPDTVDYKAIVEKALEYIEYNDDDLYTYEPDYDYEENIISNYDASSFREDLLDILKGKKD